MNSFDSLFEQLLAALQSAEKRHRAVRDSASDNSDWNTYDSEGELISNIIKWRRNLEPIRSEIVASGAVSDVDTLNAPISILSENISTANENDKIPIQAEMPSRSDNERIGRYVWQKMQDLSKINFRFSEEEIENLQNPQWCYRVLNIPYQFFLQTTDDVRYYWKHDIFTFNDKQFRLCMIWYNDLYRGRSQRECFDEWYDSLNADIDSEVIAVDDEDDVKVGKHIQVKLRELSESGFTFTKEQITQMCDLNWSRQTFTYDRFLPFAQIANMQGDISNQTKDKNGHSRYWNRVFRFGDIPLLIISQWYAKDKDSFDKWYDEFMQAEDTLMFKKTVDWSTLNYGISVPVANWDLFFKKIGQTVSAGDSCTISIEIDESEQRFFNASVIHTVSGSTNSVQIRYAQESKIVSELRRIFKRTLDYCTRERNINGEDTRVVIPKEAEEFINIYATGTAKSLKFICSPLNDFNTISQGAIRYESIIIHAKQQSNGDNIVEVSTSFVPILTFPDRNIIICAKLLVETQQVTFRAEVNGVPYPEKIFNITYLKEIALLENNKRIHKVAVPDTINTSKQMMFMAWIDPIDSTIQEVVQNSNSSEATIRTKPTKITLLGKEYPVRAWNELFIKVCEVMLLHKPYIVAALDKDMEFNTVHRTYFSYIQSDIAVNGKRLSNGLWVETNMNNQEIQSKSRRLLEKCGFSSDNLQIETMEVL